MSTQNLPPWVTHRELSHCLSIFPLPFLPTNRSHIGASFPKACGHMSTHNLSHMGTYKLTHAPSHTEVPACTCFSAYTLHLPGTPAWESPTIKGAWSSSWKRIGALNSFFYFLYSLKPKSGKGPSCQHFPSMKARQSRKSSLNSQQAWTFSSSQGGLHLPLKFSMREKMSWFQVFVPQGRSQGPKSDSKLLLCSSLARLGQGAFP